MAARCAPASTASAPIARDVVDDEPMASALRSSRQDQAFERREAVHFTSPAQAGTIVLDTFTSCGIPAVRRTTSDMEQDDDRRAEQTAANQRHPQGRAAVDAVEHIDITSFDARPIVEAMGKMSFTSRDLARATGIYNQMLDDPDCSIFLVDRRLDLGRRLHGSLCRAGPLQHGRRDRRHRRHDRRHGFLRSAWPQALTKRLKSLTMIRCARSTSTASTTPISTKSSSRIATTRSARSPTPGAAALFERAFIREMGKWLSEGNGKKDNSLVKLAYEHDVPIFCPAFTDSSAGFGLVKHQVDAMKAGSPI